jgi:hypothetical protein
MSIKTSCTCGFAFAIKDEFAGKRVKCPKCGTAISVPGSPVATQAASAPRQPAGNQTVAESKRSNGPSVTVASASSKKSLSSPPKIERKSKAPSANEVLWNRTEKFNPVLDLLDEAGVKRTATGPICPHCEAEMAPTAIICVHCGYNKDTGEKLETLSDVRNENESTSTFVETDTETLLAKAERDIKNAPNSALNQDFGDGSDSIVVALGALLGFGLIIVAGVMTVLMMDRLAERANPALISLVTSSALVVCCYLYITYTAFRLSTVQGIICALTVEYCVIFAFMQGRSRFVFGAIMKAAMIIAIISGLIYANS